MQVPVEVENVLGMLARQNVKIRHAMMEYLQLMLIAINLLQDA